MQSSLPVALFLLVLTLGLLPGSTRAARGEKGDEEVALQWRSRQLSAAGNKAPEIPREIASVLSSLKANDPKKLQLIKSLVKATLALDDVYAEIQQRNVEIAKLRVLTELHRSEESFLFPLYNHPFFTDPQEARVTDNLSGSRSAATEETMFPYCRTNTGVLLPLAPLSGSTHQLDILVAIVTSSGNKAALNRQLIRKADWFVDARRRNVLVRFFALESELDAKLLQEARDVGLGDIVILSDKAAPLEVPQKSSSEAPHVDPVFYEQASGQRTEVVQRRQASQLLLYTLEWAVARYSFRYLMKVDDRAKKLNMASVYEMIGSGAIPSERTIAGVIMTNGYVKVDLSSVDRDSFFPEASSLRIYPTFFHGKGFLASHDVVRAVVSSAMHAAPFLAKREDVSFGLWTQGMNVTRVQSDFAF